MKVDENVWKLMQQHLGYSEEEMELFRRNPKNAELLSKAPALMRKTIVAEVVDSQGCNSRVGDQFYFDGSNRPGSRSGDRTGVTATPMPA